MSLKGGFLPSTDNSNVYTSRELIKPFEYLFVDDENSKVNGIIPGFFDGFKVTLVKHSNNRYSVRVNKGVGIFENPDNSSENNIIYLDKNVGKYLDTQHTRSSSSIGQITYTNKSFFELFNENRRIKNQDDPIDSILILEVYISLSKEDSSGNAMTSGERRYVHGPELLVSRMSKVRASDSPEDFYYACNEGASIGSNKNKILLGWVVGNLAYNPKQNDSDPSNDEIFNNAIYFYDYRKFSKSILQKHNEYEKYIEYKRKILKPLSYLTSITTSSTFSKNIQNVDQKALLIADYVSNALQRTFLDIGATQSDYEFFQSLAVDLWLGRKTLNDVKMSEVGFLSSVNEETFTNFIYSTNFSNYPGGAVPTVYKMGNIVKVYGGIIYNGQTTNEIVGFNPIKMASLPANAPKPKSSIHSIQQCSGPGSYLFSIEAGSGDMFVSRIVKNARLDKMLHNEALTFEVLYII